MNCWLLFAFFSRVYFFRKRKIASREVKRTSVAVRILSLLGKCVATIKGGGRKLEREDEGN